MKHRPEEANDDATASGAQEEQDPARDAPRILLNRLRDASVARGEARAPMVRRRRSGGFQRAALPGESYSGRDPQGLGTVFGRLLTERGWNSPVAVGSVMARWAELVGPDIAAHCTPEGFHETTVLVRCDSTAWATQLRLISSDLIRRFDQELGAGVVTAMTVIGPSAPNWKKGGRTVRGRGPRDTYG